MSNEVRETLNDALVGLLQTVSELKDFAVHEAPDVIQQLMLWKTILHSVLFVGTLVLLVCFIWHIKWACTKHREKNWSNFSEYISGPDYEVPYVFAVGIFLFITIPVFITNGYYLLQILVAPKIYIIEYISSLVK